MVLTQGFDTVLTAAYNHFWPTPESPDLQREGPASPTMGGQGLNKDS